MNQNRLRNEEKSPILLLKRADQVAVAFLLVCGFVAMGGWWLSRGGFTGRTVEFDRVERRQAAFQVDLNQAEWPELSQLPQIGETLARRIVESRDSDGPYLDHESLMRVRGIGPKTLEDVRPYLLPMASQKALAGQDLGHDSTL